MDMESDVQLEEECENNALVSVDKAVVMESVTLEDESEDEDVDFNPFLKEALLEEASSSLSSDVEGLDTDVGNSYNENEIPLVDDIHGSVEGMMEVIHEECGDISGRGSGLSLEQDNDRVPDNDGGTDGVNVLEADLRMVSSRSNPMIDLDNEDAICKRTRARYSLASFTLDELETFLQETDDEDDFQNVDDEEEYKKFLAAVLNGGNGDEGNLEGNDDDDEDNDADFEIEIEEALESDIDDCVVAPCKDERIERASRRPETRRKGQKKGNAQNNKGTLQGNMPLRPLIPVMPTESVPCLDSALVTSLQSPQCDQGLLNGFQPHQLGQLYCLIYEHVQLLVQVYSLSALDSSRQHIASQTKGFLAELLHKRDLVLSWRKGPYSTSCFIPSYICPSVSVDNKEDSGVSPEGSQWLPVVGDSVLSVLDVAPIKLVGEYIDGVSNAVQEHQRRCVETTNMYLEKQPLFPFHICSSPEVDRNISKGDDPSLNISEVSSTTKKLPKKTLAATLVENTKKQSVALVPQKITKLAQPFYSLFNPALFPYKPPSQAVVNRVLFTDAEDVLLAMGIMEYNHDWKSIKQRFLPCKSEHQIFVRAKNRCSAKAPDNPIKNVRKMKTSPLTEEEKARIQEGLKAFKLDWTSVWRNIVPYRDPNLLPRQWRIAIGTQKSYKANPVKKEKHRVYELNRRRSKAAAVYYSQTGSEKENESGDDCIDNDNEAYVHEAFLADWRPTPSGVIPSDISASRLQSGCRLGDVPFDRSCDIQDGTGNQGNQEFQSNKFHVHEVSSASEHCKSLHPHMTSCFPLCIPISETFGKSPFRSQRAENPGISNLVKLAPELPPVKLPAAVRVISQASLRSSQVRSSGEVGAVGSGLDKTYRDPAVLDCSTNLVKPTQDKTMISNPDSARVLSQKDELLKNGCLTKERGTNLDSQMHPLLFRTVEEGHLPCYPVNSPLRIPTFSFFPPMQHQMNATLLQNPSTAGPDNGLKSLCSKEIAPPSSSLDFHPLLQRAKEFHTNSSLDTVLTGSVLNTDLELSRDQFMEDIVYDASATVAQVAVTAIPTSPIDDANGLDLDIHLSSASKRIKVTSQGESEINPSSSSVSGSRVVESVNERSVMHSELSDLAELQPTDLVASRDMEIPHSESSAVVSHKLDGKIGNNGFFANDNVGIHPLLEVVMEQEELSDSDEEELEDVEFVQEEISDSDLEEGFDTQEIVNSLNQEQSDAALGTVTPTQLLKSLASEASEKIQVQRKGRTPRLGLAGPRKGKGKGKGHSKGSWLSLNSQSSHYKPLSKTKSMESGGGPVPSLPNRNCKMATSSSKGASLTGQITDVSHPGSLSASSRKSRKHSSKSLSPLRADVPAVNLSCVVKNGVCSKK